jgi:hypothetical protein
VLGFEFSALNVVSRVSVCFGLNICRTHSKVREHILLHLCVISVLVYMYRERILHVLSVFV